MSEPRERETGARVGDACGYCGKRVTEFGHWCHKVSKKPMFPVVPLKAGNPMEDPEWINDPHCPKCGYTYQDCRFHMDHHLCGEPEPPCAPRFRTAALSAFDAAQEGDKDG